MVREHHKIIYCNFETSFAGIQGSSSTHFDILGVHGAKQVKNHYSRPKKYIFFSKIGPRREMHDPPEEGVQSQAENCCHNDRLVITVLFWYEW